MNVQKNNSLKENINNFVNESLISIYLFLPNEMDNLILFSIK